MGIDPTRLQFPVEDTRTRSMAQWAGLGHTTGLHRTWGWGQKELGNYNHQCLRADMGHGLNQTLYWLAHARVRSESFQVSFLGGLPSWTQNSGHRENHRLSDPTLECICSTTFSQASTLPTLFGGPHGPAFLSTI